MPEIIELINLDQRGMRFISKLLSLSISPTSTKSIVLGMINEKKLHIENRLAFNRFGFYSNNDINEEQIISWVGNECIDLPLFDWIDTKNSRLCIYAWSYIRLLKESSLKQILANHTPSPSRSDIFKTQASSLGGQYFYEIANIESLPKDNKTRKENIIEFFDLIDCKTLQKKELLEQLKLKWMRCTEKNEVLNWTNKNNQQWAWHYLFKDNPPIWFINNNQPDNYLNGVVATFDLLNDDPDKRELLISKMKSAWSQKAYRDKNNGKKAVSIVLSEDIIKKLDFICENTDRRKNEVVTRLIREEYEQIKKGGH
ncbi:hypothetical protein WP3W19E03_09650 [Aeromonas veronii]|uniref:Uncharacterized protein n=2 Tax=Aeromonas TaxID=642 RepID=A0A6S5BSS5_AERVE|nr:MULTISPECIES: hypothetical protein [Aeromonas]BBR38440.1 hypothetical protein WP3W19E03_09650 [Aeromonas veronii]